MKRNTAGQKIGAQIITAADGTAFAGSVTVYVTKDAGTQAIGSVGSGAATSEGNGYYTYAPSQAETDGDLLAFTFVGSGAITVTVQVVPSSEVWDVAYANHNIAGSFGKLMNLLRKSNQLLEATVLASPAPSTTSFTVSGLNYPSGAFAGAVLMWDGGATLAEQNSPILSYVNNGDSTSLLTIEQAFTSAPVAGDLALIIPTTHVHSVAEIQAGLSTLTAGQVNAQVLDVLTVDLFGELAAVPGASSSLKDKIAFLFMLARNKVTQTSSTQTLFADNTTTPVAAATTSDVGGTFTRGEFA